MFRNRVFVLFTVLLLAFLTIGSASAAPVSAESTPPPPQWEAWSISGNAGGGGGVVLSFYITGFLNTVTSAGDGSYTLNVPDGWAGIVTPSKPGYTFTPSNRNYSVFPGPVTADITGQNYVATASLTRTPTLIPTSTRTPTGPTPTKTATPTTPPGFTKIYPWNGVTKLNPQSITFSWKSYSGAQKYRYCIDLSNNNDCDAPGGYTSQGGTSVTLTNLLVNRTYYWHVQAITCLTCVPKTVVDSNKGTWWSFTTGYLPTATPTKTPLPSRVTLMSVGAYDGWILESSENSGVGGTMNAALSIFAVGDNASKKQYRAILSFNTASLPNNAIIRSVTLKIAQNGPVVGTNPFTALGQLAVDIRQGVFGSDANLALEDFNAAASATKVGIFGETPASGWYSAVLNSAGRSKLNRTGLTQLRLYFTIDDNNNLVADYIKFLSGNSTINKPLLLITYSLP